MAHEDYTFSTTRIVQLEDMWNDHNLEGVWLGESDVIERDGKKWAVIKEGGDFHLRLVKSQMIGPDANSLVKAYHLAVEYPHGHAYRPIHPSMKPEDIEAATFAHDNGTHWLFAHCSPEEQVDYAADVRTFALEQFSMAIKSAQVKVDEATNNIVKARAIEKVKHLIEFAVGVASDCYSTVIGATLGHYHKDRHHDHRREIVIASITKVIEEWRIAGEANKSDRVKHQNAGTVAAGINTLLSATHTIEWRHEREARLEEEKKKKEAPEAAAEQETQTENNQGE